MNIYDPDKTPKLTNRCLDSKSPYVRSHASNPVAWQLWDPVTLALARETNRLLFVSIGYSACHWCHVMAHESFDSPRIAALLNDNFIPVKIDREERPDIDKVYMDFLQATTGSGGWPLNVFVLPDLQPLFGGTYWPGPGAERPGRGGSFETLLEKIASTWKEQESRCREDAGRITSSLRQFAQEGTLAMASAAKADDAEGELPDIELLEDAYQYYRARFDADHAGFGGAPKFPTPQHLAFLLKISQWPQTVRDIVGDDETVDAQGMVVRTLTAMANGGIKDQVGHGFARYSVTRDWSLPHFEKMLYDNAQLLNVYLDAYLATKDPLLLKSVHDVASYLTTAPIQSPNGGFNASEDADSAVSPGSKEHKEGAYYVWTKTDFDDAIGDPQAAKVAGEYFNIQPDGNVSPRNDLQGELVGQNTLSIVTTIAELQQKHSLGEAQVSDIISSSISKLRQHREASRSRPHLDDKIVVSWNGLAISALSRAAFHLSTTSPAQASAYLSSAVAAATFIHTNLWSKTSQTLIRVYREGPGTVPGFAEDYAFLIAGLLDLYTATSDSRWLEWATQLQTTQVMLFYDKSSSAAGGFFSTQEDSPDVLIRTKDAMDNAEPSANGVSVSNLFRLASLLGQHETSADAGQNFHALAVRSMRAFEVELGQHPGLMTGLLDGVVIGRLGLKLVTVSGSSAKADKAMEVLRSRSWPGLVVLRLSTEVPVGDWLKTRNEVLAAIDPSRELVQICEGTKCTLVDDAAALEKMLMA